MNKDQFLLNLNKTVEAEFDKAVQQQAVEDLIEWFEISVHPAKFLYKETNDPLLISIYTADNLDENLRNKISINLEQELMGVIREEPDRHKERALVMADAFERLAKTIREAV